MSMNESGFPLAAAITPRLHLIETVDSTNASLIRDATDDPDGHPHLSALLTRDQRAGRGRLDRSWNTPPGTAVALSVLLHVGAVAHEDRGWIPLVAGASMARAVRAQLPQGSRASEAPHGEGRTTLKWPNDVLVGQRKICGILAEVFPGDPSRVMIGSGVNTTMTAEEVPVSTATSFAAEGVDADEDRLVADYLTGLRDGIAALAVSGPDAVRPLVEEVCGTLGTEVSVSLPDGTTLVGRAERLDEAGRLVVATPAGHSVVAAGDVVHVRRRAGAEASDPSATMEA